MVKGPTAPRRAGSSTGRIVHSYHEVTPTMGLAFHALALSCVWANSHISRSTPYLDTQSGRFAQDPWLLLGPEA
jgi:hypothetical protein